MDFFCTDCEATLHADILDFNGKPHDGCPGGGLWVREPTREELNRDTEDDCSEDDAP